MRVIYTAGGVSSLDGLDWSSAVAVPSPDAFHSIDAIEVADSRRSEGGRLFSRRRWRGWQGALRWTVLGQADRDTLYAWWAATAGWRQPFALEDDDGARYLATMESEAFPLAFVGGNPPVYSMDEAVTLTATERQAP
jgi:hypothetical protein